MRILHLMLSCFYIDNASYQENIIPRINKNDGHDVKIIASTEIFNDQELSFTKPSEYINSDGIHVTRLPYRKIMTKFISSKLRYYSGLYEKICDYNPDIILFHGAAAGAIKDVANYKKNNPEVKFYIDSHEDFNNSANTFTSKYLLHALFYKKVLKKNINNIDKILYITKETHTFLTSFYQVPEEKLSFYPLGGIIPTESERKSNREKIRKILNVSENDILCIHTGKLSAQKRTFETIEGFSNCKAANFKLIIIGSAKKEIQKTLKEFEKKDKRIKFIGWKNSDELQKYLMAGDLYLQLGSQSVTMQQAACNGCAVALFPYESHLYLFRKNAFYISNKEGITELLSNISVGIDAFSQKRAETVKIAREVLDYNKISSMIYDDKNFS